MNIGDHVHVYDEIVDGKTRRVVQVLSKEEARALAVQHAGFGLENWIADWVITAIQEAAWIGKEN